MKSSNLFLAIGTAMLLLAIGFVGYAFQHPGGSFPFPLRVTYILYVLYCMVTAGCLLIGCILRGHKR